MSQPTVYNRVTSFTTDQAFAPATPLAGANFDAEFNAVKTTVDQILTNLAIIQRDDTHLANASVGLDQLDTTVVVGFNLPTAWVTAHSYAVTSDAVFNGVKLYRCAVSHTSGVFATDLAAGKWTLLADFTPTIANASNVAFTPAQGIVATDTQAAVVEVKADLDDITGWRNDISGNLTTAGTSSAFVLTTGTPFASLAAMANQPITFIPHTDSAAAATLAVDGLAAKKIRTATGVDLATGALVAGTPYLVVYYNGVGEFLILNYTDVRNNVTIRGTLAAVGAQTYTGAAQFNGTAIFNAAVTINSTLGVTGIVSGANGAVGTPAFTFTSDTDCGLYRIGANNIGLAVNGAKVVDVSTAGVAVTGTLGATGNFAVNTNKLTVDAATGNVVIAGTLSATGDTGLTGNLTVAGTGGAAITGGPLLVSAAAGIGYTTGAGANLSQSSSKSTTVVCSPAKPTGTITMNNASLGASTTVSFQLTNSLIAGTDVLVLNHISGGTAGAYTLNAQCGAGLASINVHNILGGPLSEAIVIQYALIKSVQS